MIVLRNGWRLALTVALMLVGSAVAALDLDGRERGVLIASHVGVLHDPGGRMTLSDAIARDARFTAPTDHPDLGFGYTADAIWLKLPLHSRADASQTWRLEFSYATVDHIDLHDLGLDGIREQRGGDRLRFSERSYAHRNPVFTITLEPGESRVLYLRAQSMGTMTLSASIWNEQAFRSHSESLYAAQALYVGTALALALYNLLLFTVLRERSILLYVAFVLCFATGVASMAGFGSQFIWPDSVEIANRVLGVGFAASSLLAALYARAYLGTAQHAPRWHRLLGALAVGHAVVLVIATIGPIRLGFQSMSAGGVLNAVLIFAVGVRCAWRNVPGARVLVAAWFALLFGALLTSLRNFGWIPNNTITIHAMPIGSALEMLLLSFGLAARFNALKRQQAETQVALLAAQRQALDQALAHESELESRVAERTAQLESANRQLRAQALRDPLTGLANRAALDQQLAEYVGSGRFDAVRALLIDLDGFKPVNDQFGHAVGDEVLQDIATRIQSSIGPDELAARLGGDEFVVLTRLRNETAVRALSDRIREAVAAPLTVEGVPVRITASIGIASLDRDTPDARTLLMRADRAMYAAKTSGGDRIHWATL